MNDVTIPEDLALRAQALADAEGISLDTFVTRCVGDAVGWMEQTEKELNGGVEVVPSSGGRTITLKESAQMTADCMRKRLNRPMPNPVLVEKNKPMSVGETNRRMLIAMGALPGESA